MAGAVGGPPGPSDPTPHPDWTLSPTTHKGNGGGITANAARWACHGTANKPHSASDANYKPGIAFDAYQDCAGAFITQQICIKLQERDYYGNYYDRTAYMCSVWTVNTHVYKSAWVSCSGAAYGTFRTAAYGKADPNGTVVKSSRGTSDSATLCQGY